MTSARGFGTLTLALLIYLGSLTYSVRLDILYHEIENDQFFQKLTGKKSAEIYKLGKENNIFLELLFFDDTKSKSNKSINDTGITHICLNVSNLNELYFELSNKKINFINEPIVNESKTAKVCFCYDPEGNLLEFVESL
jgi:hypothetical protein